MGYCVMMVVDGPGLGLVAGDQRGGVNGRVVAPSPPPFLHPKQVKERRPESVEIAKLYTPLGNQERMLKKDTKNLQEKSREKCKIRLAL